MVDSSAQAKKSREAHPGSIFSQQTVMYNDIRNEKRPNTSMGAEVTTLGYLENIKLNEYKDTIDQDAKQDQTPQHHSITPSLPQRIPNHDSNAPQSRGKKKIIRKIIRKRTQDGSFVPIEATKTVIDRDGSRSITRLDPEKYATKLSSRFHIIAKSPQINSNNQAN